MATWPCSTATYRLNGGHDLIPERGNGVAGGFEIEIEVAFREVRFFLLNYYNSPHE